MLHPWLLWGFNSPWCLDRLPGPLSPCLGTVRRAARSCGLKEVGDNEEWTVYWTDYSVSLERVMEMKRFQVKPLCEGCQGESSGGRQGAGSGTTRCRMEQKCPKWHPWPPLCISSRGCRFTDLSSCCVAGAVPSTTLWQLVA